MANVVIANAFLGEPLRIRDVMGGAFVIIGVGFIGGFSPYNPEPLTGERLHELVAWPGAITIYCVYGLMMLGMLYVVRKYGHTSVYYHILLTSAIGSFSVISSRPVATFTLQTLAGAAAGTVDSRLQAWVPNKTVCEASDGFGDGAEWRLADPSDLASVRLAAQARAPAPLDLGSGSGDYSYVPDALTDGYGCYYLGIGQLHHPSFWVFLLLLIISAFAQLKYLNDALRLYSYADVIPYHYACFTTLSVLGSMIVFKEFQLPYYQPTIVSTEYSSGSVTTTPVPTELTTDGCPKFYELHFFLDGLGMTFMGVYFLVTMRDAKAKKSKGGKYTYDGLLEQVENGEQPHASVDLLEETEGAEGGGEQPEETATARTDVVEIHLGDEEFADSNGGAAIDGQRSSNLFEEESPPSAAAASSNPFSSPKAPSSGGRLGSALGNLSREESRKIIMGGDGPPSAGSSTDPSRRNDEAAASDVQIQGGGRERGSSILDQVAETASEMLPLSMPRGGRVGFDARAKDDTGNSRVNNVVSLFAALGGGHQAAFMFDPSDRESKNKKAAARRASERARRSTRMSQSRSSSAARGRASSSGSSGRDRAWSTPMPPPAVERGASAALGVVEEEPRSRSQTGGDDLHRAREWSMD